MNKQKSDVSASSIFAKFPLPDNRLHAHHKRAGPLALYVPLCGLAFLLYLSFLGISSVLFEKMYCRISVFALSLFGLSIIERAVSAPPGFPASGNGLWFTEPGVVWATDFLPIGNGYLAAMTPGGTIQETTQLNIESLWSGGSVSDPVRVTKCRIARSHSFHGYDTDL